VLPDLTALVRLGVTDEELDERRLAGAVRAEDGDTGGERDLQGDVVQLLDVRGRVLEADLAPEGILSAGSPRLVRQAAYILSSDFSLVLTPSSRGGSGNLNV
jgi:hypothetical protein